MLDVGFMSYATDVILHRCQEKISEKTAVTTQKKPCQKREFYMYQFELVYNSLNYFEQVRTFENTALLQRWEIGRPVPRIV